MPHLEKMNLLGLWQSLPALQQRALKKKEAQLQGDNFLFWRAILGGALTYTEASRVDMETLLEANAALTKSAKDQEKAANAKK